MIDAQTLAPATPMQAAMHNQWKDVRARLTRSSDVPSLRKENAHLHMEIMSLRASIEAMQKQIAAVQVENETMARRMAGEQSLKASRTISAKNVKRIVTQFTGVSATDIDSRRRKHNVVIARHICMYVLRKMTTRSYPHIGNDIGGRDHTTVMAGIEALEARMATDDELREIVGRVMAAFADTDEGEE